MKCPCCGRSMILEEHPTQGHLYWECESCNEMIEEKEMEKNIGERGF